MAHRPVIYLQLTDIIKPKLLIDELKDHYDAFVIQVDHSVNNTSNTTRSGEDTNKVRNDDVRVQRDIVKDPIHGLSTHDWWLKIISVIPTDDTINCDSTDDDIRKQSELVIKNEIIRAEIFSGNGYVMTELKSGNCSNFARTITDASEGDLTIVASVPLIDPKISSAKFESNETNIELSTLGEDTWCWWNVFRSSCDFDGRLKVALNFNSLNLPSEDVIQRWLGEPIEFVIINADLFQMDNNNSPILPKEIINILKQFVDIQIISVVKTTLKDRNLKKYAKYIHEFVKEHTQEDYFADFREVLQIPLQPLFDNLDCGIYETFETDPAKYKLYQNAIELALIDKVPESKIKSKTLIVMVLGAGRGPLVRCALNASQNTGRKIKIYIIEKNPNAIQTLKAMVDELWFDKDIELFSKDMRYFDPPTKADILVSELLGSFGDNELSPECLDGAQKYLKEDGISIPCKSTSYLNPIMSSKILNHMQEEYSDSYEPNVYQLNGQYSTLTPDENTYIVYLHNVYNIAKPKSVFEFNHPNKEATINNKRYIVLTFDVKLDCVLTGFAGYFDSVLYKDIAISINPETHTQGLASWFPIFFPIKEPQQLKAGDAIKVHFWRCLDSRRVWYEWSVSQPYVSCIHNSNGYSCAIFK